MAAELPRSGPPAVTRGPLTVWEIRQATDLAVVRAALCVLAGEHGPAHDGLDGQVVDSPLLASSAERLGLVFSELATNALRHGAAPVTATLARSHGGWLVTVSDGDRGATPSVLDRPGAGGHGLRLVVRLTRGAGWYTDRSLKHVWADVPDSPPPRLIADLVSARG